MSLVAKYTGPITNTATGKIGIGLDMIRVPAGDAKPYLAASCESAPVFNTVEEANAGAERAIAKYNETGVFPNMCEVF